MLHLQGGYKMRTIDVLSNLKNFDCWDFKGYSMCKEEAEICIAALEYYQKIKEKESEKDKCL